VETIGSKRSYALTWYMTNNDDYDNDVKMLRFVHTHQASISHNIGKTTLQDLEVQSVHWLPSGTFADKCTAL